MNTKIKYLQQLETDLKDAAAREAAGSDLAVGRQRGRQIWMKVAGIAAAFIVVAGAIGFVAVGGSDTMGDRFQLSDDGGSTDGPQEAPAMPSASPVPTEGDGEGDGGTSEYLDDLDDDGVGRSSAFGRQQQDLSKIIRDGRIGIVVANDSFGDAVGDLTLIAERNGGFILSSTTEADRSGTFVLRIPADRFDRARAEIRDLGLRVRFEQVTGDDVTAEFVDYQARLRILQQRKARLTELAEQADTTAEILALGRQIDEVHLRIEQIQGQLRFLNDQAAESTLRVSIKERNAPAPAAVAVVEKTDLGSSFDLAVQGFLRIVGAVIVGLGYLVPLTLLGALVWMAVWFIRRRHATA